MTERFYIVWSYSPIQERVVFEPVSEFRYSPSTKIRGVEGHVIRYSTVTDAEHACKRLNEVNDLEPHPLVTIVPTPDHIMWVVLDHKNEHAAGYFREWEALYAAKAHETNQAILWSYSCQPSNQFALYRAMEQK